MSKPCSVCPRRCGVDRATDVGYCGVGDTLRIARAALHRWEEPPISGSVGSGTIFFSGCNLRCVFCQNAPLSRGGIGRNVTEGELAAVMLTLQEMGAHNINLVTPTHYAARLAPVLASLRQGKLHIPVVYNCGGYESPEVLALMDGLVDIYLPDFKYYSSALSARYSGAADYFKVASKALTEMKRQVGSIAVDSDGLMKKGMIVRHLVLPGCREDSMRLLQELASLIPPGDIYLSLMSQYTPDYAADCPDRNLHRRVTSLEYNHVLDTAIALGFDGFFQERTSANRDYTPQFPLRDGQPLVVLPAPDEPEG